MSLMALHWVWAAAQAIRKPCRLEAIFVFTTITTATFEQAALQPRLHLSLQFQIYQYSFTTTLLPVPAGRPHLDPTRASILIEVASLPHSDSS